MRAALLQMTGTDDPSSNLETVQQMIAEAVQQGAEFILTPEYTNCVSMSRSHQTDVLHVEDQDPTLKALQQQAAAQGVWVLIGSLVLKSGDADGRFVNRSILLSPDGRIAGRYDKIHMFDVDLPNGERFRESSGFRPGNRAVAVDTGFGRVGLSICYDLRFPQLYRALAQSGATILTVPSAFSPATGPKHWQALLQARAIECGAYVLAPAQTGLHLAQKGKKRRTYGHSLVIAPDGEILANAGTEPCVTVVSLDSNAPITARQTLPSLAHDRDFTTLYE